MDQTQFTGFLPPPLPPAVSTTQTRTAQASVFSNALQSSRGTFLKPVPLMPQNEAKLSQNHQVPVNSSPFGFIGNSNPGCNPCAPTWEPDTVAMANQRLQAPGLWQAGESNAAPVQHFPGQPINMTNKLKNLRPHCATLSNLINVQLDTNSCKAQSKTATALPLAETNNAKVAVSSDDSSILALKVDKSHPHPTGLQYPDFNAFSPDRLMLAQQVAPLCTTPAPKRVLDANAPDFVPSTSPNKTGDTRADSTHQNPTAEVQNGVNNISTSLSKDDHTSYTAEDGGATCSQAQEADANLRPISHKHVASSKKLTFDERQGAACRIGRDPADISIDDGSADCARIHHRRRRLVYTEDVDDKAKECKSRSDITGKDENDDG